MKRVLAALALAIAISAPQVHARAVHHYVRYPVYHSFGPGAGRHYRNVDGNSVHSPMQATSRPDGATAHCRDGSWSFSQHHSGTCSHHGGVASW